MDRQVTHLRGLPHLPGVPHLHVNRPSVQAKVKIIHILRFILITNKVINGQLASFIQKLWLVLSVVDPREGPPYFQTKLRLEGAKKIFQDQATSLSQGLDPALVMSVIVRESPLFSYANPVVRTIILFYFIGKICKLKGRIHAL